MKKSLVLKNAALRKQFRKEYDAADLSEFGAKIGFCRDFVSKHNLLNVDPDKLYKSQTNRLNRMKKIEVGGPKIEKIATIPVKKSHTVTINGVRISLPKPEMSINGVKIQW